MTIKQTGLFTTVTLNERTTSDLRGVKMEWHCSNCLYKKNNPIDTIFNTPYFFRTCDKCGRDIEIVNQFYQK